MLGVPPDIASGVHVGDCSGMVSVLVIGAAGGGLVTVVVAPISTGGTSIGREEEGNGMN